MRKVLRKAVWIWGLCYHESTKGNGEKVARESFNGPTQGVNWCREGKHSLLPATSSALGRSSSCRPRHTLALLAESSGNSKAQLQTGISAAGFISHDTRQQHACYCAGTSRKAWHTPPGQLPPYQLWETLLRPSLQAFLPDAGSHSWSWTAIPAPTEGTAELSCCLSFCSHIKSSSFLLRRQDLPTKQAAGACVFITQHTTMNH